YDPENTVTLALPPDGAHQLSTYIWEDLAKDDRGAPQIVGPSTDPDGLFYAAASEYNLLHTCNTWAAEALHAAGFLVSGDDVIFPHQVMTQVGETAESQCRLFR